MGLWDGPLVAVLVDDTIVDSTALQFMREHRESDVYLIIVQCRLDLADVEDLERELDVRMFFPVTKAGRGKKGAEGSEEEPYAQKRRCPLTAHGHVIESALVICDDLLRVFEKRLSHLGEGNGPVVPGEQFRT